MWIVSGLFDLESTTATDSKSKLLKPDKVYNLGRKNNDNTQLVINKNVISRQHATVMVSAHKEEDVTNPNAIPMCQYVHKCKANAHLIRNGQIEYVNITKDTFIEIQSGDQVKLASAGTSIITFTWKPVCALFLRLPKPQFQPTLKRATPLSFKLMRTFTPAVTHLIAARLDSSIERLYTALIAGVEIVSEKWWEEVCQRAEAPVSLERAWEATFTGLGGVEEWSPELEDGLEVRRLKPDASRKKMFQGLTMVLLNDSSPLVELKMQLELGGAEVVDIDMLTSHSTSASLLPRLKEIQASADKRLSESDREDKERMKTGMCVLLGKKMVQDILAGSWSQYEDIVKSLGLSILSTEQIQQAILSMSFEVFGLPPQGTPPTLLASDGFAAPPSSSPIVQEESPDNANSKGKGTDSAPHPPQAGSSGGNPTSASSLPDFVPGTIPESAPAIAPPAPVKNYKQRAAERRKRGITLMEDMLVGDDEIPTVRDPPPREQTSEVVAPRKAVPTPAARSTRKRTRANMEDLLNDFTDEPHPKEEPAYKKYKRELELEEQQEDYKKETERAAEVVDAIWRQSKGEDVAIPGMSQGDMLAAREKRKEAAKKVVALPTVDEYEIMEVTASQAGRKRKSAEEDGDVDMEEGQARGKKRQARASSVLSDQSSTRATAKSRSHAAFKPLSRAGKYATVIAPPSSPTAAPAPTKPMSKAKQAAADKANKKERTGTEVQMDTDPKFLQAIASRKKGKKKEDQFDRDFNALRIAAPAPGERPSRDNGTYEPLDDFDFSGPAPVGNFMNVILTNDLFRTDRDISQPFVRNNNGPYDENGNWASTDRWSDPKWGTRPNFKAFVHNNKRPKTRTIVPVVLKPVMDYGIGKAYWKEDSRKDPERQLSEVPDQRQRRKPHDISQEVDRDFGAMKIADEHALMPPRVKGKAKLLEAVMEDSDGFGDIRKGHSPPMRVDKGKRKAVVEDDADVEDEEVEETLPPKKRARPTPKPSASAAKGKASAKSRRRVVTPSDEEDDDDVMEIDDVPTTRRKANTKDTDEGGSTLRSTRSAPGSAAQKSQQYVVMDDSDDEMRARQRRRR